MCARVCRPFATNIQGGSKKNSIFFSAATGVNDAAQNRICGAKGGPKNVTSGRFSYGRPETARHGVHVAIAICATAMSAPGGGI